MTRNVVRRTAPPATLPAGPPMLKVPDAPFFPEFGAGSLSSPLTTARYIMRQTYARGGRQTLLHVKREFLAWDSAAAGGWVLVDPDDVRARIYNVLRDKRWGSTQKHVEKVLGALRMELHYPPPSQNDYA